MTGFAKDILEGLSAPLKYLPSKYFYDEQGSKLFQAIMALPEYYLTKCEFEILSMKKKEILDIFTSDGNPFELVELGAGDGKKTRILLRYFIERKVNFTYLPIDISPTILTELNNMLCREIPALRTGAITGDYFEALEMLKRYDSSRRVILFLGSTIGNFSKPEALQFLEKLREQMNDKDMLMIGFDLVKHPKIIADAYNDKAGITRAFNLNLLQRINRELGGNFDISRFDHFPVYDPEKCEAKSYLISAAKQEVPVDRLNTSFNFAAGELVYTEVSKKYTMEEIHELAVEAGFKVACDFRDCRHYFVDSVWQPC